MDSLRELTRSSGKECTLRQWAADRQIRFPLSVRQVMHAYSPPAIWGFADLHAHPASHLGFGATDQGGAGFFYGHPSDQGYESANLHIGDDLAPCDGRQHSPTGFDFDPKKSDVDAVRVLHRFAIMLGMEKNVLHGANGSSSYESWPNASGRTHQQMHVSLIHRAWEGGLRLMIASVTDSQILSRLWNSGFGLDYPAPAQDFDYHSARRQLQFIRAQVANNPQWMKIVESPAEAREAIKQNKLAVVLGVEMDRLTAEQILLLKDEFGVRQVVPIHLANNSFGGVAVYENQFNTNNWYLNGGKCYRPSEIVTQTDGFFKVETDPTLTFRLGKPEYLLQVTPAALAVLPAAIQLAGPLGGALLPAIAPIINITPTLTGAIFPLEVDEATYATLGYKVDGEGGHRNRVGLNKAELSKLMRAGLMIDIAHMSEHSQTNAFELADPVRYPLMNSHTGMRPARRGKLSERDIPESMVGKMTDNLGVIGTSTAGYRDDAGNPVGDQLQQWIEDYYRIWNAMKFRGVALGTDFNGISPTIPNSARDVQYETTSNPYSRKPRKCKLGNRTFDFATDGLAHYGMLADFIQALREYDTGVDIADNLLFHTAEDTIEMWEQVEVAASGF